MEIPSADSLLEVSKSQYKSKVLSDDPELSEAAISSLLTEASEFGLDIVYDFGIKASDIFRSITGVAYQTGPTVAVLQDILSAIDS